MNRNFKLDTLTFQFDEIPNIMSSFKKGIYFMYQSTYYEIVSNPFFDLDNKSIHLEVRYEDLFSQLGQSV